MTIMLLAMLISDAALNTSEYRVDLPSSKAEETPAPKRRAWSPGVAEWRSDDNGCPAFFQREVAGFGVVRIGPRCDAKQAYDDLHH